MNNRFLFVPLNEAQLRPTERKQEVDLVFFKLQVISVRNIQTSIVMLLSASFILPSVLFYKNLLVLDQGRP